MNHFMNKLFGEGVGKQVSGFYMGEAFLGTIDHVRASYGDDIKVNIVFSEGEEIYIDGMARTKIAISGKDLFNGCGNTTENLHVYF